MDSKKTKWYKDITNHPGKWSIIALACLFLLSVIALIVLASFFAFDEKSFGREIGKTLLQIISVGVIGTLLSFIVAWYKQNQDQLMKEQQSKKDAELLEQKNNRENQLLEEKNNREESLRLQQKLQDQSAKNLELQRIYQENRNQFMKNILHELNEIYRGTKSARRMLRAKSFKVSYETALKDNSVVIDTQIYDYYLDKINNYQLGLETISSEIDTETKLFKNHEKIKNSIDQMEKYLHNLVAEYESNRFKAGSDSGVLTIESLKKVRELIDHAQEYGPLKKGFIYCYKDAVKLIRQELLFGNNDKGDK